MRKWLVITALALLTSCILVGDFGKLWDEGIIDPALEGVWRSTNSQAPKEEKYNFIKTKDFYVFETNASSFIREKEAGLSLRCRSIKSGRYMFLMMLGTQGDKTVGSLYRYSIDNNKLWLFYPTKDAMKLWSEKYQPTNDNVIFETSEQHGSMLRIQKFDDQFLGLISSSADDLWESREPLEKWN